MGLDWLVIGLFFAATLVIGLVFTRRATSSMSDYFVAGRRMTWWVAGTSIVATSFAADTPLVIAGWMRTVGLERNWFWWGGIMGMMLCTFFFARLWRRAELLTDVAFNELRYAGRPAAGLRMFHASYRAIIQNTLVMGWVTLAMTKIMDVTLNIPTLVFLEGRFLPHAVAKGADVVSATAPYIIAQWPLLGDAVIPAKVTGILLCLGIAALYSTFSGLWGVMATDFFQFTLAMTGTIVLMAISFAVVGGPKAMIEKATASVESGGVHNRADTETEAPEPDPALLAVGLMMIPHEGNLRWTANGLSEDKVAARLAGAHRDDVLRALARWRQAYLIPLSRFTTMESAEALAASGWLIREGDTFRRAAIPLPMEDVTHALDAAGIRDRGEIMAALRGDRVVPSSRITRFLPPFDLRGGGLLAVWSLVVFLGLQWWVGGEGGGFLAQRLFSCRNEKHSVMAMLWFNFLNFAVRPWPWIVVGIVSLVLIPDISAYGHDFDQEHAYVVMLMLLLPAGIKGLLVAALMAAYMSTISTHVNFGASYVVHDLYKRFVHRTASEHVLVKVSQVTSILLAILAGVYAFVADHVATGWFTMFELMSGTGFVLLLRWYWWRINAWSEISAMISSLLLYGLMNGTHMFHSLFESMGAPAYLVDEYAVRFTLNIALTTVVWLAVTFLTRPESEDHLVRFYRRIRPPGRWSAIARKAGYPRHLSVGRAEWACWALGVTGLFAMVFSAGRFCFGQYGSAWVFAGYAAVATWILFRLIGRMDWSGLDAADDPKTSSPEKKTSS